MALGITNSGLGGGKPLAATTELRCTCGVFQPEVAYMPVPSCETCGNGRRIREESKYPIECQNILDGEGEPLMFEASFGCVEWKPKS